MQSDVHVIGAGISGLGAAHMLARHGVRGIVHESTESIGGRAGYVMREGTCLEYGGKNYASDWRIFTGLLEEFGIVEKDRQHPNFHIVLNGRLLGLEKRQSLKTALGLVRGMGWRATLQFQRLMSLVRRHAGQINYSDGIIEEFERRYDDLPISERFHRNLAYGPLRMFSIIMGAAEPEETYLSHMMRLLSSFGKGSHHSITGGMVRLFEALATGKEIRFSSRLERIEIEGGRVRALHFTDGARRWREAAEHVISTLPLPVLADVMDFPSPLKAMLRQVRYYPLALVNAVYDRDVFTEDMNSIMFGPDSVLGHCSANRMYQRNHVRFTLSGRRARKVLDADDESLITLCEREFGRFHPIRGRRLHFHVRRHPGGICAYAPHFTRIRRALLDHVAGIGGLEIAGDFLDGHNMEGCLQSAERAVNRLVGARAAA